MTAKVTQSRDWDVSCHLSSLLWPSSPPPGKLQAFLSSERVPEEGKQEAPAQVWSQGSNCTPVPLVSCPSRGACSLLTGFFRISCHGEQPLHISSTCPPPSASSQTSGRVGHLAGALEAGGHLLLTVTESVTHSIWWEWGAATVGTRGDQT